MSNQWPQDPTAAVPELTSVVQELTQQLMSDGEVQRLRSALIVLAVEKARQEDLCAKLFEALLRVADSTAVLNHLDRDVQDQISAAIAAVRGGS